MRGAESHARGRPPPLTAELIVSGKKRHRAVVRPAKITTQVPDDLDAERQRSGGQR